MEGSKRVGWILGGLGVLGILLGIFADGIGLGGSRGFGAMQIAAVVLGVLVGLVGIVRIRHKI